MNLNELIELLGSDEKFLADVSHWEKIPPRKAQLVDFPSDLDEQLINSLHHRGINQLYSHQLKTYQCARKGKSVVQVTPTASGKTWGYNLPVLQTLLEDTQAKALYLFPTKALAQDQQSELNEIVQGGNLPLKIYTYDGDTPGSIRVSVREQGRIIITNPDMLHTGILPNHPKWIKVFNSLRFIVIDEIHTYRGIFGSHMTNLLRRLLRITRFYQSDPVFICCSATIGNPQQLAERLIEREIELIDENGASRGERHFIMYNPPLVDPVQGIRRSVVKQAQRIALKFLTRGIKTIIFARSRLRTEVIASYIKKSMENIHTIGHDKKIASYRGGYLPNQRRAIEKGLREGSIVGVVSTNALELGIDIGGLDVSVMAGYPGSIASTWQQAGRAGRSTDISVSILIASSSPLDQYVINHPEYFFGKSPESGWIDPDNIYILLDHLKCAAFEIPVSTEEPFYRDHYHQMLNYLEEIGLLRYTGEKWFWADQSYPAEKISLRTATPENVVILNTTQGKNEIIGEMDRPSAKMMLYQGAVYLHQSEQYIVKTLDIANLKCLVEESNSNYYTDSIVKTDIKVLQIDSIELKSGIELFIGDVLVRNEVTKYKKIKFYTHENIGYGDINLPSEEMDTRAIALVFNPHTTGGKIFDQLKPLHREIIIRRIGNLIENVAPLFLLCDRQDMGLAERLKDPHFDHPAVYIYDTYPGGTGISEGFAQQVEKILQGCLDLVNQCPCEYSCPSCLGPMEELADLDIDEKTNPKTIISEFMQSWFSSIQQIQP
ncbi:MAG: DEAD/DEAH box helicase [bacterium]